MYSISVWGMYDICLNQITASIYYIYLFNFIFYLTLLYSSSAQQMEVMDDVRIVG